MAFSRLGIFLALGLTACSGSETGTPTDFANEATGTGVSTGTATVNSVSLATYVGKYPFDAVEGVTFLTHPSVQAGVEGAVPDPAVRKWILERAGPQTPIVRIGDKLASWGCEQHNCGRHNWTILLREDGSDAEICYLPDGAKAANWYARGAKTNRQDACPSEPT